MNKHIEQFLDCTNVGTFFLDRKDDTYFRFLVYKKIYTPYEIEQKFTDESMFEDDTYTICKVTNVIETAGDVILECSIYYEDYTEQEDNSILKEMKYSNRKEYHKLSDIQLCYFDEDNL